jgi:hypothetical protein
MKAGQINDRRTTGFWNLGGLGAVVDVEEFEWLEDGFGFARRTATWFAVGGHLWARNYAERIAKGLLKNF